jgi:UDP-3-O-acyl-N-acetylglucosamine deacetylase
MAVALFCFRRDVKTIRAKNLELTGATMSHSLEASLVFNDSLAANETLATLGKQGQFAAAEVLNAIKSVLLTGHGILKIIRHAGRAGQPLAFPRTRCAAHHA